MMNLDINNIIVVKPVILTIFKNLELNDSEMLSTESTNLLNCILVNKLFKKMFFVCIQHLNISLISPSLNTIKMFHEGILHLISPKFDVYNDDINVKSLLTSGHIMLSARTFNNVERLKIVGRHCVTNYYLLFFNNLKMLTLMYTNPFDITKLHNLITIQKLICISTYVGETGLKNIINLPNVEYIRLSNEHGINCSFFQNNIVNDTIKTILIEYPLVKNGLIDQKFKKKYINDIKFEYTR